MDQRRLASHVPDQPRVSVKVPNELGRRRCDLRFSLELPLEKSAQRVQVDLAGDLLIDSENTVSSAVPSRFTESSASSQNLRDELLADQAADVGGVGVKMGRSGEEFRRFTGDHQMPGAA